MKCCEHQFDINMDCLHVEEKGDLQIRDPKQKHLCGRVNLRIMCDLLLPHKTFQDTAAAT